MDKELLMQAIELAGNWAGSEMCQDLGNGNGLEMKKCGNKCWVTCGFLGRANMNVLLTIILLSYEV